MALIGFSLLSYEYKDSKLCDNNLCFSINAESTSSLLMFIMSMFFNLLLKVFHLVMHINLKCTNMYMFYFRMEAQSGNRLSCGTICLKYLLFLFNILFWVSQHNSMLRAPLDTGINMNTISCNNKRLPIIAICLRD